jgi:hypothetical protein
MNEMYSFIPAMIYTCIVVTSRIIFKESHSLFRYVLLFLIFYLGFFVIRGHADLPFETIRMTLTQDQIEMYIEKIEYHEEQAQINMLSAENEVWFLPTCDDKEKAEYCFTTLIASIAAGTPQSKIAAACIAFLAKYGLSCMEQWHTIQTYLHKAKFHYEMKEFYEEVLVKG